MSSPGKVLVPMLVGPPHLSEASAEGAVIRFPCLPQLWTEPPHHIYVLHKGNRPRVSANKILPGLCPSSQA